MTDSDDNTVGWTVIVGSKLICTSAVEAGLAGRLSVLALIAAMAELFGAV